MSIKRTTDTEGGKSLHNRPRLHLHPARPRRRPAPLRNRLGALVAYPICGEDSDQRDEYAGGT